jgi:hypothetical protein
LNDHRTEEEKADIEAGNQIIKIGGVGKSNKAF